MSCVCQLPNKRICDDDDDDDDVMLSTVLLIHYICVDKVDFSRSLKCFNVFL